MKLTTVSFGLAAVTLLAFAQGCDKPKSQETEKPAATVATTAAATASAPAQLELSDEDVPVAEDFIEESTKEIDDKNYEAKLAELEKEIDDDKD